MIKSLQALRDIMEGQSINRSSNKFNIPARTLRDWMKRLNIKSVFTHHSQVRFLMRLIRVSSSTQFNSF